MKKNNAIPWFQVVRICLVLLTAGTALAALPGCALLLVGGVAAGAAYGTVEYVNNTLKVTQQVSLDRAWSAAYATLKDYKMPVTSSQKDGTSGKLTARNAQGQTVTIEETWKSETTTQIEITVGTFDSSDNRAAADQIYQSMQSRF